PIASVNKLVSEQNNLCLIQIYSTNVTRSRVYWNSIVLAFYSSILGVLVATLSLGLTGINAMEGHGELEIINFLAAGYNFLPAILFVIWLASQALVCAAYVG